jgi:uncharacterized protein YdeI (BOF family)
VEGESVFARVCRTRVFVTLAVGLLAAVLLPGCASEEPLLGYPQDGGPAGSSADGGAGLAASAATTPSDARVPEGATRTVRALFAVPIKGEKVVISGRVTEMLAHNDFVLEDGTGAIHVVGDENCTGFGVGDTLIVTGVVDVEDSPFRVEILTDEVEVQ